MKKNRITLCLLGLALVFTFALFTSINRYSISEADGVPDEEEASDEFTDIYDEETPL